MAVLSQYALTSLEAVKEYIQEEGTTHDNRLINLINRVTDIMESWLKRKIKVRDYSEKYDGNGDYVLLLNQYPVNSISSLKIDGIEQDPSSYVLYGKRGEIRLLAGYFPKGYQNVEVTYNAGYSNIPGLIEQACIEEVVARFKRGQVEIESPEGAKSPSWELHQSTKKAIKHFRKRRIR